MKISIISLTQKGAALSAKIAEKLPEFEVTRYCFYKYPSEGAELFSDLRELTKKLFYSENALIFICACGIAVRVIAPFIESKITDPAVIAADDNGRFLIPVLSGHLGGANALAKRISENIGAMPVITTATDSGGKFSPDSFAKANDLIITDMTAAKEIAAAVLRGEKIGFCSDYHCENIPQELISSGSCSIGIKISADTSEKPFAVTLCLIPKNIIAGIGCRKNTPYEILSRRVRESFLAAGINPLRICSFATIDIKSGEMGIAELCREYGVSLSAYTSEELMAVEGNFTASPFVKSVTGADNVCERSAVLGGNKLIMPKNAADGVTVAAAEREITIDFERNIL